MLLGGLLPLRAQPAGLEVITSGERKWELLLQDIAGARQTIDLEYYLLADDASGRMIRDALEEKVREGVRIYEYQPRFNHSKTAVCDDRLSWIGSVNLDCRSLQINYEVAARIEDPDLARQQKATFLSLLDDAHEVTLTEVQEWSAPKRLLIRLPRLIRHQL